MFKVGDVVTIKRIDGNSSILMKINQIGKVIDIDNDIMYCVEFNENIGGHDGLFTSSEGVRGKNGHCWWCFGHSLTAHNLSLTRKNTDKSDILSKGAFMNKRYKAGDFIKLNIKKENWFEISSVDYLKLYDNFHGKKVQIKKCLGKGATNPRLMEQYCYSIEGSNYYMFSEDISEGANNKAKKYK